VTQYRLVSSPRVDLDIEAAFEWYERERVGLGLEFLDQLRAAYGRIASAPIHYQDLRTPFGALCCGAFHTPSTSSSTTTRLS
jgi:hypothetical protein